jgi:hypothetical protein
MQTTIKDGLHLRVPFAEYLKWPFYSQSVLKEGRRSMAHLKAARDGERVKEPTDDMILGTALHCAFLEPEEKIDRVAVWREGVRRGARWEAFKDEHARRIILTESQDEKLEGMLASLRRHPVVRRWDADIEAVECSIVGMVNGLRMKGRCDALTPDPLIDLKKVADGVGYKVQRAAEDFGYHIQAAIYCQLFKRERFMLICVEDEPPYDVCPYEFSPGNLRRGAREAADLIARVLQCEETGCWPGRSDTPIMLEAPAWAEEDE